MRTLLSGLLVRENGLSSFATADFLPNSDIHESLNFNWSSEEEKEEEWLLFETALEKPSDEWPEALKKHCQRHNGPEG